MNIFDYLQNKHLGEIKENPNEADLAILTFLSYTKFELVFKKNKVRGLTIGKYCEKYFAEVNESDDGRPEFRKFLRLLVNNPRYNSLKIIHLACHFDSTVDKQYASMAFRVGKKNIVVAYRGTDSTLTGWKEDINMAVLDVVPSQIIAVNVLDYLLRHHPFSRFYITGHSKGGLLAVYAATNVNQKRQKRIAHVAEYDGPGLKKEAIQDSKYLDLLPRIHGYIPEHSVIGLIFYKKHAISVIKSSNKGVAEHDLISWEIEDDHLVHLKEVESRELIKRGTINDIIDSYPDKDIRKYIDNVYKIIGGDDVEDDITKMGEKSKLKGLYHKYKSLDKEDKKMVRKMTWKIIWNTWRNK